MYDGKSVGTFTSKNHSRSAPKAFSRILENLGTSVKLTTPYSFKLVDTNTEETYDFTGSKYLSPHYDEVYHNDVKQV
jgi:hypothetical protein